jgi:D-glycero-alpha-D-manno-heptose-7-phosphate kinase
MILARSPLRITLGGGGTDLPTYYKHFGGSLISAAIDKYVYVAITPTFLEQMLIRYSKIEWVDDRREIKHPIIREALDLLQVDDPNLEITTIADIPAGTGLGSSGSFTTALLKALIKHKRLFVEPRELAEMACHIEIERLGEPVGKQDQYIAAYGGLTCFDIAEDGTVEASALQIRAATQTRLSDHLLLFSTGFRRSAGDILEEQDSRTRQGDDEMIDNLHHVKRLGEESRQALEEGDLNHFGGLLDQHWQLKKKRSGEMSNSDINRWYEQAMLHGALGGKLIGAGGGGFLMFYTPDPPRLRKAATDMGLVELRFSFDFEGTKLLQ